MIKRDKEREKGRRIDIEREGEIRKRDVRDIERVKGRGIEHSCTGCALS